MPAGHVGPHDLAHLRIDPADDLLHEQAFGEFVDVGDGVAAQHPGTLADEVLEFRAAQLVIEPRLHHADELADRHLPAPEAILRHHHTGEPGHERAVEVEEGTYLRALWRCLDLGDGAG